MKLNEIAYRKALMEESRTGKETLEITLNTYITIFTVAVLQGSHRVRREALGKWRALAAERKFRYY